VIERHSATLPSRQTSIGQTFRLEPPPIGPNGRPDADDWEVVGADDARNAATLRNRTRGGEVIIRRFRRQSGERGRVLESLIPHASAVRALMVTMIEASFGTPSMTRTSRAH
jgi:hypothetical protein